MIPRAAWIAIAAAAAVFIVGAIIARSGSGAMLELFMPRVS